MSGPPAPPPPPPPPPPPAPSAGGGTEDMASALFAEINSLGEKGARAGLKKATRGPVNEEVPATFQPKPKPAAPVKTTTAPAKKPVCELSGKKWSVEYQKDNQEVIVEVASMKHTVYVYKCEKSVIQVKGKCNSISIDSCKKVDLVFEDALSQVEIVNSDSVRVQCTGNAPSINIDGCNSVTYFMSEASVEKAMVITSKSAAINLIRPKPEDPDDIIETPIPEQFCTTFKDGEFVTEAVDHDD
ncbi:CARP motif [Gracilaria domingensis]|nr:CARP motif [Gracilaria domingensis]